MGKNEQLFYQEELVEVQCIEILVRNGRENGLVIPCSSTARALSSDLTSWPADLLLTRLLHESVNYLPCCFVSPLLFLFASETQGQGERWRV